MNKKPRCSTCSTGWCKNHLFQLNPYLNNLHFRKNFKIRLCPRFNKQTQTFQKIIPLFNHDNKHYTPSFYLDEEKKYYQQNDARVFRNHNQKTQDDAKQEEIIWVPRYARKRNYCFVCKTDYNDYLDHLNDPLHKKFLRNNLYTQLILEIEAKFTKQGLIQLQQKKQEDLKRYAPVEQSTSISQQIPKTFDYIRKLTKPNQQIFRQSNKKQIEQI